MGATVTNENRGITTKTSDHTYSTTAPTDVCWNPPVSVQVPHVNNVKTDKAVEHTSGKTLFQNGNVVRVQEALMPSDPAHGDIGAGGGVKSHTYRLEARATSGSPNVRVEGLPPARTDDPTTQNHSNTVGKIYQVVPPALLEDNPEEYFKRCSYDTSTIKCDHAPAVKFPQIDVKRGDTITIEAKRKNAKVPNAAPECANPPHMKWKVTRSGGTDWMGANLPPRSEEFTGDTLVLDESWIPSTDPPEINVGGLNQDSTAAKQQMIRDKNNYAAQNAAARGSPRVENQDGRLAYQQVNQDRKRREAALDAAEKLKGLAEFLVFWRAMANPVRVAIVGNACSGSVTYEVHGYPEKKYEYEIPLEGLSKTVQWINRAMAPVRTIGQLANVRVENSLLCPAGDVKITLAFEWKEGGAEYAMTREASIELSGKILEWKFEVSVPLTNFLAIIPFAGAVASRAVGWIIQRLGADASVGIGVEITLSAAAAMAFSWNKRRGWAWEASITLPLEVKIYGYIRVRWRDNLHIEGQLVVQADPALKLEGTSAGLVLKNKEFELKVGLTGTIKIDVWFYSYENTGEWFPDCLKCQVPETELWNIIGN